MHQPCANGAHLNGDAARNGDLAPGLRMPTTDQEIVRLIGQHLLSVGLERSAALLMEESGLHLEHPAAATFRQHVLAGDWVKADHDLRALHDLLRDSPHQDPHNLAEMKFVVLEQKYLEHLEAGRVLDALHVLRNELTPLQYDTPRVHRLSALMMCADAEELRSRAQWPGGTTSRAAVLARVQAVLPPALMMAPGRLRSLLAQAAAYQAQRCRFHAAQRPTPEQNGHHIPFSLLADHQCSADQFPIHPLQVLNEHCDEVWYCKWSPDGSKLASGSKDHTVMIWDFDPVAKRLSFRKSLEGHLYGVSYLSWSPDGRYLIAAGPEDCPDLWIWNMETEQLHLKMTHSQEDSLTAVAWHATSDKFVCGGARGQFYHCTLDGTLINNWDGVRVNALACRADGTVLAADTHHRVRAYDFSDLTDRNLIQEEHAVMAMSLNAADTLLLLNVANQGVHLWDIRARALVRRFRGLSQGHFTIHACFGGAHQDFIASGSEDNKVYIWQMEREEPIAVLSGHTRCVNAVAWNPTHLDVLVSASDDYSLRLWGPRDPRV
ncbi:WD repeat-containing protein 26 [Zerene cesonia]|uniref:WD repeat-containing protein 26 n=1 Tax=Zerene cesonia TaxID=33412 RepID=UPI0018E5A858|nr:WD repeat-containing protein 26 [Zerene cesonia]